MKNFPMPVHPQNLPCKQYWIRLYLASQIFKIFFKNITAIILKNNQKFFHNDIKIMGRQKNTDKVFMKYYTQKNVMHCLFNGFFEKMAPNPPVYAQQYKVLSVSKKLYHLPQKNSLP
jgi:hypothetical protein